MFDGLSRSLEKAWDSVRKDGKLTADNIKTPMREIRRALLEADVSTAPAMQDDVACTLQAMHLTCGRGSVVQVAPCAGVSHTMHAVLCAALVSQAAAGPSRMSLAAPLQQSPNGQCHEPADLHCKCRFLWRWTVQSAGGRRSRVPHSQNICQATR